MVINNKNSIYFAVSAFAFGALALVLLVIIPLFLHIKGNAKNLASMQQQANGLQKQNHDVEEFKQHYADYKNNLDAVNTMFIDRQNPVGFITFLETAASEAGINVQISLSQDTNPTDLGAITFSLFASANFLNILQFVQVIEHGPYLIDIENAAITNSSQADAKNNPSSAVDATFQINAFSKS